MCRLSSTLLSLFLGLALSVACKRDTPTQPAAPTVPAGQSAQDVRDLGPAQQIEAKDSGNDPGQVSVDKDKLWACYQEIYCAQKKGEMDRILEIYRKCGFENPQDFAAAWIEAAKDTEWVSRLAQEVSRACK